MSDELPEPDPVEPPGPHAKEQVPPLPAQEEAAEQPLAATPPAPSAGVISVPEDMAATDANEPAGELGSTAERLRQRLKIGSERETAKRAEPKPSPLAPAATPPAAPPPEPKHYPPPNIRDRLSADLEEEFRQAVGDVSLDELLTRETGGDAAVDLADETRVTGRVAKLHREDVFIDLGGRNQGIAPLRQFDTPPQVGAELELVVVRFNAEDGLYELSLPTAAVNIGNWDDVVEGQIIEVNVTGSNKGGLECQVAGLRGFIPMGQVSLYRVETPEDYVGQRLACVVTEANRDRRNLVLSHRAVMERERQEQREKLLAELAPGQIREGVVRSLKDFGAFVDLGGVDGLVHISQLSWDRVGHPSEVLQVGQTIKVRVEKIDKDTGKVGLSYREAGANPWDKVAAKYTVGARVMGVVSRTMDFGAFVKLEPGVEGLVHVSELAHGRVWRASDVVSEGQELEVKVLSVDVAKQRISLSLRALAPKPTKAEDQKPADEDLAPPPGAPKPPPRRHQQLKGGVGGNSGGEQVGLNW
jgi:predicted RNA-binding protein with RPS1 domain